MAALAGLSPEDVVAELTHIRGWQPDPSWWGELHNVRRRVAVRSGDYALSLLSVAATVGSRAAIGVVTPDRILAQRCQPLVAAAAAGIARALAGTTN